MSITELLRSDESRRRNVISRLLFRLTFIPDQAQQPGRAHTSNIFSPNKPALPPEIKMLVSCRDAGLNVTHVTAS